MITISVDDGSIHDWHTATLLEKYGLKATFYWSKENPKHEVMTEQEMVAFTKRYPQMETGNHTYSHPLLTQIDNWKEEIDKGLEWHTNLLGKPTAFCPPRGYQNEEIEQYLRTKYESSRLVAEKKPDAFNYGTAHVYNGNLVNHGRLTSLFFHSHEIQKFGDWEFLELILSNIKPEECLTNSEYVRLHFK